MPNITPKFIDGLPHTPYDNGIGEYIGVLIHSTGNYGDKLGDSCIAERNYEAQTWGSAFVHYFTDHNGILQVANTDYICYGAGKNANHLGYVQIEMCQRRDKEECLKGYDNMVWLTAFLLTKRKLGVVDGKTLMSHKQASDIWKQTTHQDPIEYLATFGKTWNDVIHDVTVEYYRQNSPVVPNVTVDAAVEFICSKIKSKYVDGWKQKAKSVHYLDVLNTKIATKWKAESRDIGLKNLPPIIKLNIDEALAFIDSKVHLSDLAGWKVKARNVPSLDEYLIKIAFVWQLEQKEK
jgi:N-acetylmuramoyl-L-alanine amidase CwlA